MKPAPPPGDKTAVSARLAWTAAAAYLGGLVILQQALPETPLDPWGLLHPKKIITLILALSILQVAGAGLMRFLGRRSSALLTGLLGGFVSSTATTAGLAKKSRELDEPETRIAALTFLSATLAMLAEALLLVLVGSRSPAPQLYLIFAAPILLTLGLALRGYRKAESPKPSVPEPPSPPLKLGPILKLTAFIVAILGLSKILQQLLGESGLMLLTFAVSLFEIHGSVIANIQLHEYAAIQTHLLLVLLTLSVLASYVSKIFLVYSLGNRWLKHVVLRWTLLICGVFLAAAAALYVTL